MRDLLHEDMAGGALRWPMARAEYVANNFNLARGLAAYGDQIHKTAISSEDQFLEEVIDQIVLESTSRVSWSGGGITQLVNAVIQIVEESYVALPRNRQLDRCLENLAERAIGYVESADYRGERDELEAMIDALDEYGFTLVVFYGQVADRANLRIRVLSRLLLIGATRSTMETEGKSTQIDFHRLNRINQFRNDRQAREGLRFGGDCSRGTKPTAVNGDRCERRSSSLFAA